jgi:hypothetical protein
MWLLAALLAAENIPADLETVGPSLPGIPGSGSTDAGLPNEKVPPERGLVRAKLNNEPN